MIQTRDLVCAFGHHVLRWRGDAVSFCRDMWGESAVRDSQQVELLSAMSPDLAPRVRGRDGVEGSEPNRLVAVKSGHGTGKTAAEAMLTLWKLLVWDRVKVGVTAPSGGQLDANYKPELRIWESRLPEGLRGRIKITEDNAYAVEAPAMRYAVFRQARRDQPEALQGLHAPHVLWILEEATGIDDAVWDFIMGSFTDPDPWLLAVANPTRGSGRFHRCFHGERDVWTRITLSSERSSFGGKKYAEMLLAAGHTRDDSVYQVRVLGEFPAEAYDQLIGGAAVESSMCRVVREVDVRHAPVVLGVDTAWYGDDACCVYLRQGLASRFLGKWWDISTDRLGGLVARFEEEHSADAVVVDVGGSGGGGVVDVLRGMGRRPIPAYFGGKALNEREYSNRRVEMWFEMKRWLEVDGGCVPRREDLRADLTGPNYWHAKATGKKILESKDEMRHRGLHSPDEADALALTFYCGVRRRRGKKVGVGSAAWAFDDDESRSARDAMERRRNAVRVGGPLDGCPYPRR